MNDRIIKTFSLTIDGETREVEARDVWGDGQRFDSVLPVGAYRKSPGAKVWADRIFFWRQPDGSYKASRSATILNRAGYPLIGWADKFSPESASSSKHNSAANFPVAC